VLASGITSIAGFGVLAFSGITMLRDFGLATVVDLSVALAGVMLVLPAALVWAEGGYRPLPELYESIRGGARRRTEPDPTA
jgi:predicted RND superfamily exporter protein